MVADPLARPRPGTLADPLTHPRPGLLADPLVAVAPVGGRRLLHRRSAPRRAGTSPRSRRARRARRLGTVALLSVAFLGFVLVLVSIVPKGTAPSEGQALPFRTYQVVDHNSVVVPAEFPKNHLSVPNRKGVAPIDKEGIDGDGYLGIPQDVGRVGVYTGAGQLDGSVGDVVIAGHVNWVGQGAGYLGDLDQLKIGDIIVTRGTGQPQAWKVTKVSMYLKSLGLPQDIFRAKGVRTLTLVTCGGVLDTSAHSYLSNVVVTAMPEPTVVKVQAK